MKVGRLREDREKNVLRGHAFFVRFMERHDLGDCIKYFPDTMTLGDLKCLTSYDLMSRYDLKGPKDCERILKVVSDFHKEDQSDSELECGFSPKQQPTSLLALGHHKELGYSNVGQLLLGRTLCRAVSEDMRLQMKMRDKSSLFHSSNSSNYFSGGNKHFCSQYGLNQASSGSSFSNESGNLLRLNILGLGKSAPLLSTCQKDQSQYGMNAPSVTRQFSSRLYFQNPRLALTSSSLSLANQMPNTPVVPSSPIDSPRTGSVPNHNFHFQFFLGKNLVDSRRWSVASLASSGSGNNTPACTATNNNLFSSQDPLFTQQQSRRHHHHHHHHHHLQQHPSTPDRQHFHRHFSSSDSNPASLNDNAVSGDSSPACLLTGFNQANLGPNKTSSFPLIRPRSQSLSSPAKSSASDVGTMLLSNIYRDRFPKAVVQMEERLKQFVESCQHLEGNAMLECDGAVRFIRRQIVELAKDCLSKSKDDLISLAYFYELSENLEKLLKDAQEKSQSAVDHVAELIKKFLIIISRPARLLECLEFDPQEFYRFLEVAEGKARETINTDIPRYIISKLALANDSILPELTDVSSIDSGRPDTPDMEDLSESGSSNAANKPKSSSAVKQPGQDDFETIKLISNGAYGAVYLVRHKESKQMFAMKRLLKSNLLLRNQVDQVFVERDILTFTDNPFVVSFFCSFETKKHLCMVLEYVEGGDCATLLKNVGGPLSFDLARMYFAETILALEYLHSYGIVHRDLKPDNLLITLMGHIKLTDFGLSKMGLMNLTTNAYERAVDRDCKQFKDKQVFGTPEYIAPEVILRQGYGKPVDWWSMGIILYEFLVGCVPFYGDTPEELFTRIVNDPVEWPREEEFCPPSDAQDVILQLLDRNPLDRLGSGGAAEVKEHLFFEGLDWNGLLRLKAEFVPNLVSEEDTSYFDSRLDRYNPEGEDTDDSEDVMFNSFSSCSPRYSKVYLKFEEFRELGKHEDEEKKADGSKQTFGLVGKTDSAEKTGPPSCPTLTSSQSTPLPLSSSSSSSPPSSSLPTIRTRSSSDTAASQQQQPAESPLILPSTGNKSEPSMSTFSTTSSSSTPVTSSPITDICTMTKSPEKEPVLSTQISDPTSQLKSAADAPSTSSGENPELPGGIPQAPAILSEPFVKLRHPRKVLSTEKAKKAKDATDVDEGSSSSNASLKYLRRNVKVIEGGDLKIECHAPLHIPSFSHVRLRRMHATGTFDLPKFSFSTEDSADSSSLTDKDKEDQDQLGPLRPLVPSKSAPAVPLICEGDKPQMVLIGQKEFRKSPLALEEIPISELTSALHVQTAGAEVMPYGKPSSKVSLEKELLGSDQPANKSYITIKRGQRGYGFTLSAIRVYYGDSHYYTLHHLVVAVENGSPAKEGGLKPGDLITHVNNTSVQGLLHIELVRLMLASGNRVTIRTIPLSSTTIRLGNKKRSQAFNSESRYMQPLLPNVRYRKSFGSSKSLEEKKKRSSLFRRLSNRKVEQLVSSPVFCHQHPGHSIHHHKLSFSSDSSCSIPCSPTLKPPLTPNMVSTSGPTIQGTMLATCPLLLPLWRASNGSSERLSSSSPGSSSPGSPAFLGGLANQSADRNNRPSSLYGLRHDLRGHGTKVHKTTSLQLQCSPNLFSNRRRSWHNNPLSPLVKTPSSSTLATPVSRSPSPSLFHLQQPGISNTNQLYNPSNAQLTHCSLQYKKVPASRTSERLTTSDEKVEVDKPDDSLPTPYRPTSNLVRTPSVRFGGVAGEVGRAERDVLEEGDLLPQPAPEAGERDDRGKKVEDDDRPEKGLDARPRIVSPSSSRAGSGSKASGVDATPLKPLSKCPTPGYSSIHLPRSPSFRTPSSPLKTSSFQFPPSSKSQVFVTEIEVHHKKGPQDDSRKDGVPSKLFASGAESSAALRSCGKSGVVGGQGSEGRETSRTSSKPILPKPEKCEDMKLHRRCEGSVKTFQNEVRSVASAPEKPKTTKVNVKVEKKKSSRK